MPKGKGTKVTLSSAKKAIQLTLFGRRRLTLSNMGLTTFPTCLLKLSNLDELDLSRNKIMELPDNIGNLSSLKWLDLHSNKLESVPESIGNVAGLTHLNLANNCLTSAGLPSSLGFLSNLKSLNLGLNQLESLPPTLEFLDNLKELGLFDNSFVQLPEFVRGLRSLTKLNVSRNPLTCVEEKCEEQEAKGSESTEDVYLVHESSLCDGCLQKVIGSKEMLIRKKRCDCVKPPSFSGLVTPNSVAINTQHVWRMKDKKAS